MKIKIFTIFKDGEAKYVTISDTRTGRYLDKNANWIMYDPTVGIPDDFKHELT
jgi:hypothetical protein